jgi:ferredoxin
MRIALDRDKCTGIGLCESFASDVFEVDDDGGLIIHGETVPEEYRDAVLQAIEGCPTEALRLVES